MDEIYLRAWLDEVRFALPALAVAKILSGPAAVSVPDAPEGICGIVYDEGTILPIRSLSPQRHSPSQLVILCAGGAGRAAYAADRVETLEPLSGAEQEAAVSLGEAGILLFCKEGTA